MRLALVLAVLVLLPRPVAAQGGDDLRAIREEIESLKAGLGAIQRDVQEIKALLQAARAAAAPPPVVAPVSLELSVADGHARGAAGARVAVVEFSDFQCPFCGRHARQTLPQIQRDYVDTGKILYVMRNMPLESIHPDALRAAGAAECAGDQGKYWEMHEKLFAHQQALGAADLVRYAQEAGLEPAAFTQCLEAGTHGARIRKDLADAQAAGVNGTPTFFLGFVERGGTLRLVRRISGAHPYPVFKSTLDTLLADAAKP